MVSDQYWAQFSKYISNSKLLSEAFGQKLRFRLDFAAWNLAHRRGEWWRA
jgi:hypothetical protein